MRYTDRYSDFAELAATETEGRDFAISVHHRRHSDVAILAPHGGSIERRTSAIARAIAQRDFNLYLFEGLDSAGTFDSLHITSHRFDEPACLRLVGSCATVIAIHGCGGDAEQVLLGGRDEALKRRLSHAIRQAGVEAHTDGHRYPGRHRLNICNRGRTRRGVQLELTDALRGGPSEAAVIEAIRSVLDGL